ncbi:hypothetical protein HEP_00477700, partial [Hepatocystis sp. ex Piliocolobus tephrosceles]
MYGSCDNINGDTHDISPNNHKHTNTMDILKSFNRFYDLKMEEDEGAVVMSNVSEETKTTKYNSNNNIAYTIVTTPNNQTVGTKTQNQHIGNNTTNEMTLNAGNVRNINILNHVNNCDNYNNN